LSEVRRLVIRALGLDEGLVSLHEINRNREEALGLYPRRGSRVRREVVGICGNRAYEVLAVTLLLRWGRDGEAAEIQAYEIYKALAGLKFDGGFVRAVFDAPVWLGADGRGVFEWVLDFDFYWS